MLLQFRQMYIMVFKNGSGREVQGSGFSVLGLGLLRNLAALVRKLTAVERKGSGFSV